MARPSYKYPTSAELEVLKIIWQQGPCTVRDVMNLLNKQHPRAYTSVMSLMSVMAEKGLLSTKLEGRAFVYSANITQERTQASMLKELLDRAFEGSANAMVVHLLQHAKPNNEELEEIQKTISDFTSKKGGK